MFNSRTTREANSRDFRISNCVCKYSLPATSAPYTSSKEVKVLPCFCSINKVADASYTGRIADTPNTVASVTAIASPIIPHLKRISTRQ